MSRCFGSSTDFIAKDFIEKKRNDTLYCHLKGKYTKLGNNFRTNNTNVASGKINNYKSYDIMLNLSRGYEINKRISVSDLSSSYFGQVFTDKSSCNNYVPAKSNTDISNNYEYHGTPLKTTFGSYPAEGAFDSQGRFWANSITFIGNDEKTNNVYAEVDISNAATSDLDTNNKFLDKRKKQYTNCSQIEKRYTLDLTV